MPPAPPKPPVIANAVVTVPAAVEDVATLPAAIVNLDKLPLVNVRPSPALFNASKLLGPGYGFFGHGFPSKFEVRRVPAPPTSPRPATFSASSSHRAPKPPLPTLHLPLPPPPKTYALPAGSSTPPLPPRAPPMEQTVPRSVHARCHDDLRDTRVRLQEHQEEIAVIRTVLHGSAEDATESTSYSSAHIDQVLEDDEMGEQADLDKLFTMDAFDLKECKKECDAPWAEGRRRSCRAACGRRAREVYTESSQRERAELYARLEYLMEEKEAWRAKERLMQEERAAMENKLNQRAGDASREKAQWKKRSDEWREAFVAAKRQCSKHSAPPPHQKKLNAEYAGTFAGLERLRSFAVGGLKRTAGCSAA